MLLWQRGIEVAGVVERPGGETWRGGEGRVAGRQVRPGELMSYLMSKKGSHAKDLFEGLSFSFIIVSKNMTSDGRERKEGRTRLSDRRQCDVVKEGNKE